MMELLSPYLEAIQEIPGSSPGDKYKEINIIAKGIAETFRPVDGAAPVHIPVVFDIPRPLVPLVQLESANLMRQYNVVVGSLITEDNVLIQRVLKMRWFFSGDNKKIISPHYFENYILPYLSLETRGQVFKTLAMNLKSSGETKIAEEFYTYITRKYGRKQAEPLLVACSNTFIFFTITTNKIVLSCRIVRNLFDKYPDLIIAYMKLSKPIKDKRSRNCYDINICQYSNFLPRLIKKHINDFVELLEMHNSPLGVKLSNKATESFLKTHVDVLLNKPQLYTQLMPLKVIAAKLTKPQYRCMVSKLFPERVQMFHEQAIKPYLEYYPEQERLALAIDTYREVYNTNLLDNSSAVGVYFMHMLPAEERVRQARIKLVEDPDWQNNRYNVAKVWRCYLPIVESIPAIKNDISRSLEPGDRASLLNQMFYACKVNDDKDALVEALRYFVTRHKNEDSREIFEVLDNLMNMIDLSTLGTDHWSVINELIQFLHVTNVLKENLSVSKRILVAGVHFNFIHNLPVEDKIATILDLHIKSKSHSWSLLEKHPEYDRRCIDALLSMIPRRYPIDDAIWAGRRFDVLNDIVETIYDFNTRNAKANCKIDKLSIKNYPWLVMAVKDLIQTRDAKNNWKIPDLISTLKIHENDLYKEWISVETQTVVSVETGEALVRLGNDPKNILENWEEYLNGARQCIFESSAARRFIKATRWYQKIPIKFTTRCVKDAANEGDPNSLMVLGILMEGEALARVVESIVPTDMSLDPQAENAAVKYELVRSIPKAMNFAQPPVPLETVLTLCQGDYLKLGLICLTNVCRRTSFEKVKPFTKKMVESRVSVKKHGIRLFCMVSSINSQRAFLAELWRTENHTSTRAVVFDKIYSLFVNEPSPETWWLMQTCINDLRIDDESSIRGLMKFRPLPDRFIADYIKHLLERLEKLEANGYCATRASQYVSIILGNIDGSINDLMPEYYCEHLLRKYFCNPKLRLNVNNAGVNYAAHVYLQSAQDRLGSRLAVICHLYEDILKKQWNVPHPKAPGFFTINHLAHTFMMSLIDLKVDDDKVRSDVMEEILKSFVTVLKPQCDFESYALLTYGVVLRDAHTPDEIVAKIGETLPRFVEVLSLEMVVFLAEIVKTWIERLINENDVDDVLYALIESLCCIGTECSCLLAAKLLHLTNTRQHEERRVKIFEFLRQSKYSAVMSLIYHHSNIMGFPDLQE